MNALKKITETPDVNVITKTARTHKGCGGFMFKKGSQTDLGTAVGQARPGQAKPG